MSEKFDAEAAAAAVFAPHAGDRLRATRLAREAYAAGARERAEDLAEGYGEEIRLDRQSSGPAALVDHYRIGRRQGLALAAEIARRHAAPPSPPTREEPAPQQHWSDPDEPTPSEAEKWRWAWMRSQSQIERLFDLIEKRLPPRPEEK